MSIMNKIALTAALLPMMALALTGCKDDTQPRLSAAPAGSFELYQPALNNYTYYLDPDGTINFTTSGQPDYGVATPTCYEVQVSLTNEWKEGEYDAEGEEVIAPTYYSLGTVNTQSVIAAKSSEIAIAMCYLMGIREDEDEGLFKPEAQPLYVRVAAYVKDPKAEKGYVDYTYTLSNVITLPAVVPYFVVPKPGVLYMIGNYQGWNINGSADTYTISEEENGIGSQIYTGYANLTPDQASGGFRFYKTLGVWGDDDKYPGVGASGKDQNNPFSWLDATDNTLETECMPGKGNWNISDYPGGWMKITINLKDMTASFEYTPDYEPES